MPITTQTRTVCIKAKLHQARSLLFLCGRASVCTLFGGAGQVTLIAIESMYSHTIMKSSVCDRLLQECTPLFFAGTGAVVFKGEYKLLLGGEVYVLFLI